MDIAITNVHLDLGAGRRGTDMGPSAIHVAGLIPGLQRLGHRVTGVRTVGVLTQEATDVGDPSARFLPVIEAACSEVADLVEAACDTGQIPLVLGGDHAQAAGTIAGMARHHHRKGTEVGVLWVDAHTDMNTPETTPSGNIHGMPLACLLGHGPKSLTELAGDRPALLPENVVVFGARDVDSTEIPLVKELGIRVYTMSEIDARGTAECLREALAIVLDGTAGVHLSFDLDGVDPNDAPGVGTPVPGGLSLRESHLVCEMAARSGKLLGMEMVELNPTFDLANKTGKLAVWLIHSAMGKSIL
ncbi:MAG: arginase [Proteobacteria bacterium]|nr:arginase [Pseudomonadota bacterium]